MIIRILNDDETKFEEIYINDNVTRAKMVGVGKVVAVVTGAIHSYLDDRTHKDAMHRQYLERRRAINEMTDIANESLNPLNPNNETTAACAPLNMDAVSR